MILQQTQTTLRLDAERKAFNLAEKEGLKRILSEHKKGSEELQELIRTLNACPRGQETSWKIAATNIWLDALEAEAMLRRPAKPKITVTVDNAVTPEDKESIQELGVAISSTDNPVFLTGGYGIVETVAVLPETKKVTTKDTHYQAMWVQGNKVQQSTFTLTELARDYKQINEYEASDKSPVLYEHLRRLDRVSGIY